MLLSLVAFTALLSAAFAQNVGYSQCGGIDYEGPTACQDGFACTAINPWYSQCLSTGPVTATTTSGIATATPE
ncbi:hypothetical protein FB45DRAFT_901791 [Roridomyces roridus]|uniref:CBM1 domain-containing protein n=1 Tax=Roridomyces roridus TaxID=1738132 RepID=A0AAD7C9B1_9AGAR|nr:hypothetical protein FB45DRAFT_901791 [Roridomyces roridus]